MIKWVETDNISLYFNENPKIQIREVLPIMTSLEKKDVVDYPYMLMKNLEVKIKSKEDYSFKIPHGYCYNGADIPKVFWRIIGSQYNPEFLVAALLHDFLCERHYVINNDRKLSSEVFYACLIEAGVSKTKARIMTNCVDVFQKMFCNW